MKLEEINRFNHQYKEAHFKKYGVVTSESWHAPSKPGRHDIFEYVMVIWYHGVHTKYKTDYLEVISGRKN